MQSVNQGGRKRAVIIGAGPAGLTAAYELLLRTDIVPVILEKSDCIGGLSRTVKYNGNRIDIGGHRFFSKSDRVMQWWLNILPLEESADGSAQITYHQQTRSISASSTGANPLEQDNVMLLRKRKSRIYFMRQLFEYPITLSRDTLSKLGIAKSLRIGFSYLYSLLFPIRNEQNLEQFFINRFGRELYLTFFKSYTEKVWGIACRQISAEWGAQRIKGLSILRTISHVVKKWKPGNAASLSQKNVETSLIEQFLYPKFGPGQMWEEVAGKVRALGGEIRMNASVQGLEQSDGGEIVSVTILQGDELQTLTGDYFFSTMPVQELVAEMTPPAPAEIRSIAAGLVYRDFITVGVLCRKLKLKEPQGGLVKDNWIYIQEPDVSVGRIQIFNNWSPFLVADPATTWIGLEYFCTEGDALWQRNDNQLIELAKDELVSMNMLDKADVIDATVIRMPKTYPAYFGTYNQFPDLITWANKFSNLYLIGRNGMHKYNNQDHSMLTAMTAVDNIVAGNPTRDNIWALNAEQDYHEEEKSVDSPNKSGKHWQVALFALVFGALLCMPAVRLSLWLDEVLQLLLTRGPQFSLSNLLQGVAGNAGGVPLGYVTQSIFIHWLGYSELVARLPSIFSAIFTCIGFGMLALKTGLRRPLLALTVLCALPLQLRYATEARPYEQALCFSVWSTVVFLKLIAEPSVRLSIFYGLVVGLAVYTQPFTFFIVSAHLVWFALEYLNQRQQAKTLFLLAIAALAGGCSFIPWFHFANNHWHQAIAASTQSQISVRTLLVIAHEFTGAGYMGTILAGALICFSLRSTKVSSSLRLFWLACLVVPVLLTLFADAAFGYFFAIRQVLFVLPAAVILLGLGLEYVASQNRTAAGLVTAALFVTFFIADFHSFSRPREDWQRASLVIESNLAAPGSCYLAIPQDASNLFRFFDPLMNANSCPVASIRPLTDFNQVVVATSPYANGLDQQLSEQLLRLNGFQPASSLLNSRPNVQIWKRH